MSERDFDIFEPEETVGKIWHAYASRLDAPDDAHEEAGVDLPGGDGRLGAEICHAARRFGLLTRPVLDTVVLMPPLSISEDQIGEMVGMLGEAWAQRS